MRRQSLRILGVAGVVILAGCAGGLSGSAVSPTQTQEAGQGSNSPTVSTTNGGTVAFYVSDETNAMGDFRHLNVTITRVGFERADGGWVERDVDNATVDLTTLQGANATLIDEYNLSKGTYSTVFVHVGDVNATLGNGDQVRVKLPSEKLQIQKSFTVDNGSAVNFVFDITVHKAGKSGKYILKPVISESGTNVPIKPTADDTRESELTATFLGNVTLNGNATVTVTRNGSPVENATITVNNKTIGVTGTDGRRTFDVPNAESLTVTVQVGDEAVELEREFGPHGSS